jgi:hypothetical protein
MAALGFPQDKQGSEANPLSFRVMYSIYDTQLRRLMLTGRNSATKEAAKDDLLHYLSADCSHEELEKLSKLTPDELATYCHCQILKHSNPYPDDQEQVAL